MKGKGQTVLWLVLSVLVGAYDVYAAVRGHGHNFVAWGLAVIMAVIAIGSLRALLQKNNSNS